MICSFLSLIIKLKMLSTIENSSKGKLSTVIQFLDVDEY